MARSKTIYVIISPDSIDPFRLDRIASMPSY